MSNKYICDTCKKGCNQVYGANVNNRFIYQCTVCTFKKPLSPVSKKSK